MTYWIKAATSFLAVFLVCLIVFTAASYWRGDAKAGTDLPDKSFLWKISSPTNHIYLLGSLHFGNEELYPLDNAIEAAFKEAKYLVVELDIFGIDTYSLDYQNMVTYYATYGKGEGLKENLPSNLYEQLKVKLEEMNVDITLINNIRPWLLGILMGANAGETMTYDPEYGIDSHFLSEAKQRNIQIIQLEKIEDQLIALSDVTDEVMVKSILSEAVYYSTEQTLEMIFDAWETGNAAKLEGLTFLSTLFEPELAPYYGSILTGRTFKWMDKIEKFLTGNDTYFVVVGAGHLVGEYGLLNLLKEKGYTLEQLPNTK